MLITHEIGDMKGCNRCADEKGVDMALDRQFSRHIRSELVSQMKEGRYWSPLLCTTLRCCLFVKKNIIKDESSTVGTMNNEHEQ